MDVLTFRLRPVAPLFLGAFFVLLSLEVGRAFFDRGPTRALALALLPGLLLLVGKKRVLFGLVVGALGATVVFGRDFAHLGGHLPLVGQMYILDLVLAAALIFALSAVADAIRTNGAECFLVGAIVLVTIAQLLRQPIDGEALRDSVIGLYSLWAVVGMMLVAAGKLQAVARVVYAAGLGATVVFGLFLLSNSNPFTSAVTPKLGASSYALYLGFGILLVLIAPSLIHNERRRHLAYGFAIAQGAVIAASQSRSLWVAMVFGLAGTTIAGGLHADAKGRLFKFGLAFVGLAVVAAIALPSTATRLASVAHTLVHYDNPAAATATAQVKVLDTQWRLKRWEQAFDQDIKTHPLTGIGFGDPVIADQATRQAYESVGEIAPRIDPHNSFIAFAARMGIPAFILLLLFEVMVFRSATRAIRANVGAAPRALVSWLLGCQLMTAGHAFFTVVLEGPYMGLFFWLFGGMVIGVDHAIRRGTRLPDEEVVA